MRVFLAGATGTLGRPTSRAMVAAGHAVRGVARGPAKAEIARADGGEPVEVGLFDVVMGEGAHVTLVSRRVSNRSFRAAAARKIAAP